MSQLLSITVTQPQKKFVTDLFKTKAGTIYINNELAKKASQSNLAALKDKVEKLEERLLLIQRRLKHASE